MRVAMSANDFAALVMKPWPRRRVTLWEFSRAVREALAGSNGKRGDWLLARYVRMRRLLRESGMDTQAQRIVANGGRVRVATRGER